MIAKTDKTTGAVKKTGAGLLSEIYSDIDEQLAGDPFPKRPAPQMNVSEFRRASIGMERRLKRFRLERDSVTRRYVAMAKQAAKERRLAQKTAHRLRRRLARKLLLARIVWFLRSWWPMILIVVAFALLAGLISVYWAHISALFDALGNVNWTHSPAVGPSVNKTGQVALHWF